MPWFKAACNIRCDGTRYLKDSVFELDAATAKKSDMFVACDAPSQVAPKASKKAPPVEAKKPVEQKAPEVKVDAPKVTDQPVK
jgi:hypothetical protein